MPEVDGTGAPPDAAAAAPWQPAPPPPNAVPGAAGFVYADVPNRIIALIIDSILLAVVYVVLGIVMGIVGLAAGLGASRLDAPLIIFGVLAFGISILYYVYSWTRLRSTVGMRMLGMQVGNAFDGRTLTSDQAVRRAIALWGPQAVAQVFSGIGGIGSLLSLLALAWAIYLLYTTAQSPTKQGFHDMFANSVVVKASRTVAA
jgi:uncharacterized RDD family membrane protein YckC